MALKRRGSKILDDASVRANNLRAIDVNLDLGNGLTLAKFDQLIADGRSKMGAYNQALTTADDKANELVAAEKLARDFSARMLAGVKAAHGSNGSQYEMAGGTRDDERKRPVRQKKS